MAAGTTTTCSPLKDRSFQLFLSSRAAATVAYQMAGVAVGWQLYELTRRAMDLGLVGLLQFIPSLLLVLYVGHAGDRYDRRRIVSLAQLAEAAALLCLLLATLFHTLDRGGIFLLVFILGIGRAFDYSTTQALAPSLVEPEELPRAIAASSSVKQAATIVGPMLGGILCIAGPLAAYAASFSLFVVSATIISFIRIRRTLTPREPASLRTIFAGITFIRNNPVVLGAVSFDLFAVLCGGVTALLPIYARDILQVGPQGLGLLRAAPAVGALAAAIYLARNPLASRVGRVMFVAVAIFGAMTIVFALSRSMLLSLVALVVLGCADMLSVVIRASLVQLETPDEMRGRVSAVNAVFIGTSNELGEFESGLTAALFGTVPAALLGGIGTLAVVLIWWRLFPQLLQRDRLQSG